MQRLQFSISWLQTTEVSFTSVLETEVKIFLPSPIIPTPAPYYQFLEHFPTPLPPNYSTPLSPPIVWYSRVWWRKNHMVGI